MFVVVWRVVIPFFMLRVLLPAFSRIEEQMHLRWLVTFRIVYRKRAIWESMERKSFWCFTDGCHIKVYLWRKLFSMFHEDRRDLMKIVSFLYIEYRINLSASNLSETTWIKSRINGSWLCPTPLILGTPNLVCNILKLIF